MVKIIPAIQKESFSDKLMRGLSAAGGTLPGSFAEIQKGRDAQAKEKAARTKGLPRSMDAYLKKFRPSLLENEKKYNELSDLANKYAEQGYRHEDAVRMALEDVSRESKVAKHQGVLKALSPSGRGPEEGGFVGGALGGMVDSFKDNQFARGFFGGKEENAGQAKLSPFESFKKFNKELNENTVEHGKDIYRNPGKALAEAGHGIGSILSVPVDILEAGLRHGGFIPEGADPNLIRQGLDKMQQWIHDGKSPEEIERSMKRQFLGSLIPIGPLIKGVKMLSNSMKGGKPSPLLLEHKPATTVPERTAEHIKDLQGRVSGEVPSPATVSRVERVGPKNRIYKPGEQGAIREQQLKMEPHYAAEIEKDAAERAARQIEKAPKTVVGEAGVARRKATAEAQLPRTQDSYAKAIARVRALEDELARGVLPEQSARMDALMKAAKQELAESEFALRQTLSNAKLGEARVGIPEMRESARNKVLKIAEDVSEGKEVKLPLKDYNPDMIKQANAIEKKKHIPATRSDDFFTQVHEAYAAEYRPRLAQIEQEMQALKGEATLGNLQRLNQLKREKEVVQKLVDHIEAENAIHRHKIGLREIGQRKLARERLGKFTKQAGEENVKRLAKDALKSPEQAAEAVDAAVNEAAAQAPNEAMRQRILKEREAVTQKTQQMAGEQGKVAQATAQTTTGAATTKEASVLAGRFMRDLKEVFDSLRGSGKNLFKTRIGRDFLVGIGSEIFTQLTKGEDLPVSPSTLTAVFTGGRSGGYRLVFSQMARWFWKKGQKSEYKRALEQGDDNKLIELRSKMSPKLRKEATEEYRERISA